MLIGTAVCGKPHVRWCERAGEIKPSPLYSIVQKETAPRKENGAVSRGEKF